MANLSSIDLAFQLKRLIVDYGQVFEVHQWASEQSRWSELVFAILTRTSHKPHREIRNIVYKLNILGLLDIHNLADIPIINGNIKTDHPSSKNLFGYLVEKGFTDKEAKNSILAVCEAANSLQLNFGGKIQKYLRNCGEMMIKELPKNFKFSKIKETDINYIFTYWMQNAMSMPLSLDDKNLQKFCSIFGADTSSLINEADKLDINLALLDDIVNLYMSDLSKKNEDEIGEKK
jgi:hypothetical protein